MTNGTLTTKDGSNTLKVTEVVDATAKHCGVDYWSVLINGSSGTRIYFQQEYWDFTPEVLGLYQQVEALPVGTRYKLGNHGSHTWTKISDGLVAYYLTDIPTVNGVEVIDKGLHAGIPYSLNVEVLS